MTASAYLPDSRPGPGRLAQVPLDVLSLGPAEIVLPEATVRDERGVALLDGDLSFGPASGGGPVGGPEHDRVARAFGLVNVAFHTQRALRRMSSLLGHPLPHLLVRIGMHESPRRWGGGHYRVAARSYDPPEPGPVRPTGEVHLGGGSGFLLTPGGEPYFAAPSHNLAIIYHEIGHHVCRHTADFRLNGLRPAGQQTNKKIALDEGTCDVLTAIMLDKPDIYGWHRNTVPAWDRRRRALDPRWTMASFQGGRTDPHGDGTVWASACWTAREHVAAEGHDRDRFDRMLLRGLELSSSAASGVRFGTPEAEQLLKKRRHVAGLLAWMVEADPELTDPVLAGMAAHGIRLGASNVELRESAQADQLVAVGE
ncbi:hypothetical protein [Pseudonocardia spinosispora]|uniref:hypothetical protein n=1 Tax=Pseudonocardia spinosispora TaxID=103441 RepID=UPI00146FAAA6|nr:hypothetical protein [Pseudonocardia spinosispora]